MVLVCRFVFVGFGIQYSRLGCAATEPKKKANDGNPPKGLGKNQYPKIAPRIGLDSRRGEVPESFRADLGATMRPGQYASKDG